jgi:AraC-like DNA-binding protein
VLSSYQEIHPSPRLARYVECYWWGQQGENASAASILPDGCVDILYSTLNREPVGLTVAGLMTTPLVCDLEKGRSIFGVRFHPGMAGAFLREAALLNDKVEPLEDFWGSAARSVFQRLADAADVQQMVGVMDGFLRPAEPPDPAQRAIERLPATTVSLDRVVSDAGLSERHFRRACLERVGVPPKYLRRILRFRRAVEKIRTSAQPSWADLAAACGYYDQAHFIREFQEFAGCTPGRFIQSQKGDGGLESNHDEPTKTRKSN